MTAESSGIRVILSCVAGLAVACTDSSGPGNDHFELAFTRSDIGSAASDVYVSRGDGTNATRLTTNAFAGVARWSPDGAKIAFGTSTNYSSVELINTDGTDRRIVGGGGGPAWSPDGAHIGYTAYVEVFVPGGTQVMTVAQILRMNADGTGHTRIAPDTSHNFIGSWSPDGSRIVFTRGPIFTGKQEIFAMAANGTSQVRLTANTADDNSPVWSPTEAKIAFVSYRDGRAAIYTMNSDGTGQTRLTSPAADAHCPAWSPDGSRIAFSSNRDGFFQIYLMSADGSDQVRIQSEFSDRCPSWKRP